MQRRQLLCRDIRVYALSQDLRNRNRKKLHPLSLDQTLGREIAERAETRGNNIQTISQQSTTNNSHQKHPRNKAYFYHFSHKKNGSQKLINSD